MSTGSTSSANFDYTKEGSYPRSGRDMLGGVAFLARSIDKMRAHIAGTAGDYVAMRGLSQRVYDLYGLTAEQFMELVREGGDDEAVLRRLQERGTKQPTQQDIQAHNETVLSRGPQDEEGMQRMRANLEKLGFGDRTDVKTHVDAEDLEEGREVPRRS
ncbi:MAG TPA: DUF5069 domain-containing protein [Chloroflexota bacterium]|nr:DUF5069 domain-containing protein [Chloroflexota bacterium]